MTASAKLPYPHIRVKHCCKKYSAAFNMKPLLRANSCKSEPIHHIFTRVAYKTGAWLSVLYLRTTMSSICLSAGNGRVAAASSGVQSYAMNREI